MNDFMRKPAKIQAVKLSLPMVLLRRLFYFLAQKGDPTIH